MDNHYLDNLKRATKGRVLIYIDAANLECSVRDMWVNPKDIISEYKKHTADQLRWRVDYDKSNNFFKNICDLVEIKFYSVDFQTESHRKFLWFLSKVLKFKLQTKPLKEYPDHTPETPHRKANFDVEIAVDATRKLGQYDTLILFSGDCDFEYLIKFLRGQGKIVIVFSRVGHVAKELPPASSYYFDLIDFRQDLLKIELKKAKNLP
ncbi:MAG: NYN domain-containing protein [Patescibacteria group bacterium]